LPVRKPRGRKRPSHRKAYLSIALLVLLGGSSITYVYLNGYFPGGGSGSSTGTTTSGSGCPTPPISASGNVYACVRTSQGSFEIELFTNSAPKTVANFVALARAGFYNNLVWHRIVNGFIIQTGDPNTRNGTGDNSTWGQGGSGTNIKFENTSLPEDVGYIAMARGSALNSASSQFFIDIANNTATLGMGYAVFGRVVSGLDVVLAIGRLPVYSTECQNSRELVCLPLQPSQAMLLNVKILSGG
jgi:cyclophilin family peptidyl-prolyl cis-trans isomerase